MLSDKNLNLAWYEQPKYLLRPYAGGVGAEPHKLTKRLPFYLQKLPFLKLCTCPFHFVPAPLSSKFLNQWFAKSDKLENNLLEVDLFKLQFQVQYKAKI